MNPSIEISSKGTQRPKSTFAEGDKVRRKGKRPSSEGPAANLDGLLEPLCEGEILGGVGRGPGQLEKVSEPLAGRKRRLMGGFAAVGGREGLRLAGGVLPLSPEVGDGGRGDRGSHFSRERGNGRRQRHLFFRREAEGCGKREGGGRPLMEERRRDLIRNQRRRLHCFGKPWIVAASEETYKQM
ncbi:hypothetical protein EJ110_NYTH41916 [Nymphaea thermarum]|nr:hypothetical protein EJ110_NYTH41916 [Nymphaea thermarum]